MAKNPPPPPLCCQSYDQVYQTRRFFAQEKKKKERCALEQLLKAVRLRSASIVLVEPDGLAAVEGATNENGAHELEDVEDPRTWRHGLVSGNMVLRDEVCVRI